MKLTLIAAVAKNGVIGSKDALPWYIPEDLKHFKQITCRHCKGEDLVKNGHSENESQRYRCKSWKGKVG